MYCHSDHSVSLSHDRTHAASAADGGRRDNDPTNRRTR
jgi:hypothetical protein